MDIEKETDIVQNETEPEEAPIASEVSTLKTKLSLLFFIFIKFCVIFAGKNAVR